ncbi:MAG: efflux RND transporter periplasmic adaptor subunit [Acidobacteria bacterium]|nr:efflux RND transporter periplasmic adaptor subunit [Acidobacteriota bacterium]
MSTSKKKKYGMILAVVVLLVAAGAFATRGNGKKDLDSGIRTGKVETGDIQVKVTEVGNVEPEVKVDVKSPVSGKVVELMVRDGDVVERGQLLARVEPDLNQAQSLSQTKSALAEAEIAFDQARKDYEADQKLFLSGLMSANQSRESETQFLRTKQEFQSAKEKYTIVESQGIPISQASASSSNITAPMSGVVLTRNVQVGETVTSGVSSFNAGTILFSVADTSSMIIKAGINEIDIGKVHVGQTVKVTLDAFPKTAFNGRIDRIAPAVRVAEKIRVFDVEIRLDAQGHELRSGMTANIEILGEKKTGVLGAPVEGVFHKDQGDVVFVKKNLKPEEITKIAEARAKKEKEQKGDKSKGKKGAEEFDKDAWKDFFDMKTVETGLADNSRVEILKGLKTGEEIALEDPTLPKGDDDDDD